MHAGSSQDCAGLFVTSRARAESERAVGVTGVVMDAARWVTAENVSKSARSILLLSRMLLLDFTAWL